MLGAAIDGIERKATPPAPITGNAYEGEHHELVTNWNDAIDLFENYPLIAQIFHPRLIENLVMTKRQELRLLADIPPEDHWMTYLETV